MESPFAAQARRWTGPGETLALKESIGLRSTLIDDGAGPEVHIRAPRKWWPLIFLPVWFVVWTFAGIDVIRREFAANPDPLLAFFLVVWLVFWLVGAVFVAVAWSWMTFGREVVSIAHGTLAIRRRIGPWGISRQYSLVECAGLRAAGWFGVPDLRSVSDSLRLWGLTGGTIVFDYRGRPVRFGIGLEEAEASSVVKRLAPFVTGRPTTG